MDKLVLVLYVDVDGIEGSDVEAHIKYVSSSLFPLDLVKELNAITFVIPKRGGGTRLEALNPKYIVDAELNEKFSNQLKELSINIDHFIETGRASEFK